MATTYDIGDAVKLAAAFTSSSVAADPTTVTLKVKDPSGNESTYTYALGQVIRESVGNYYKIVSLDEAGTWYYRFVGTGAVETAAEGFLYVRESEFA